MEKRYLIGIDLHGTLLNEKWEIEKDLKPALIANLKPLRDSCLIYVCSGNDLSFINKYIPSEIRNYFDGYILETGCVISDGRSESIIVPDETVRMIKNLEEKLKACEIKKVKYFGRRLATISMFTRDESDGIEPDLIHDEVSRLVADMGFADKVLVTHSNVAVDIIPIGFNKFTGMTHVASARKTIGIADSLNDSHMILEADYSFLPSNASLKLISFLDENNKPIGNLGQPGDFSIFKANCPCTEGVIESLEYIRNKIAI